MKTFMLCITLSLAGFMLAVTCVMAAFQQQLDRQVTLITRNHRLILQTNQRMAETFDALRPPCETQEFDLRQDDE